METPPLQPGWYPSRLHPEMEHFWDGQNWTDQFRNAGTVGFSGERNPDGLQTKSSRGLSVAALVLAFVFPLLGASLGTAAFFKDKKAKRPYGLALAAVVIGWFFTAFFVVIVVVFSMWYLEASYSRTTTNTYALESSVESKLEELYNEDTGYPIDYWLVYCDDYQTDKLVVGYSTDCDAFSYSSVSSSYDAQDYLVHVSVTSVETYSFGVSVELDPSLGTPQAEFLGEPR